MNPTDSTLRQLELYLEQDPDNEALRAEAFEAAMRAGAWERAEAHVRAGRAAARQPLAWGLRHAHLLMGRHEWSQARAALAELARHGDGDPSLRDSVSQDLAYVAFRLGEFEEGLATLRPVVERQGLAAAESTQMLWLRLLHRVYELDTAMTWARKWAAAGGLAPGAAGVAALAALDHGDLDACRVWAEQALAHQANQLEAQIAKGSVLLASDPRSAMSVLSVALQQSPEDGRARSAMGFAMLQLSDLAAARREFERALIAMPGHVGTWHGLAWAALLQGDLPAAREAFEEALRRDRNFAESHGGLAVVLAREGRRVEAEQAIERAMRLDRHGAAAHYARAILNGSAADPQAVQALARRLLGERGARG